MNFLLFKILRCYYKSIFKIPGKAQRYNDFENVF